MIIGSVRHKVSGKGPHALIRHVFYGRDNEEITVLRGGKYMVQAAFADAQAAGRTYSNRHFSVSPEQATSREQAAEIVSMMAQEFGFNLDDVTVVEHKKPRHGGEGYERHWHVIVPEMRPDGSTLDSRFMRARQEKLGRLAEIRLGHSITIGKHDKAVLAAMEREGRPEAQAFAEAVRWREFGPSAGTPKAAYSADTHQVLRRNGLKTPALKAVITAAWVKREENPLTFKDMLHACGIDLVPGRRAGTWIAVADGVEVTALHRLLKVKAGDVEVEMARAQKKQAPAWTRAAGGYDALSPQDRQRAQEAFEGFKDDYERGRGVEYPHSIGDYVAYVQGQEARRNPAQTAQAPAQAAAPTPPKALPLPDDAQALRRVIGESPFPAASRDPLKIADAYKAQVQTAKGKAEATIERLEKTIERTAPKDNLQEASNMAKLAEVASRLAIRLANVVLRPLGLPISWEPTFGSPRVIGTLPGNPRKHEHAHQQIDGIKDKLSRLLSDDDIAKKAQEIAANRQAVHDEWAERTAPARLKLVEIEAREKAEREEMERKAKAEEARLAAEAAREDVVEVSEVGPEIEFDDPLDPLDRLTF